LHAAILTNSEEWETGVVKAGKLCGELCFPLVFTPEIHFPEFNSVIADMKNSVGVRLSVTNIIFYFVRFTLSKRIFSGQQDRSNAQSSCAGLFILSHLGFDYPGVWLHIDIAAPAESVRFYSDDLLS